MPIEGRLMAIMILTAMKKTVEMTKKIFKAPKMTVTQATQMKRMRLKLDPKKSPIVMTNSKWETKNWTDKKGNVKSKQVLVDLSRKP